MLSGIGLTAGLSAVGLATAHAAPATEVPSPAPAGQSLQGQMMRPLIGAHVEGVGQGASVGEKRFDATRALEKEMKAEVDVVSHYFAVGKNSAASWRDSIVPELKANPSRRLMYAFEIWRSNQEFIDQMKSKTGIYNDLRDTLIAIRDGGAMDRIQIAPFHEGNGSGGYPWAMYYNDPTQPLNPRNTNSPELYKECFRRVVDLARSLGVTCKFIQWFLVSNGSKANVDPHDIANGFVGDDYVDLVGLSYYNRSGAKNYTATWNAVGAGLRRFVRSVEAMSSRNIWICETGCAASNNGFDKGEWYADLIGLVASNEIPRVAAMIMFMQSASSTDMRLENQEQKIRVGKAINAARRPVRFDAPGAFNASILPWAITAPSEQTLKAWTLRNTSIGLAEGRPDDVDKTLNGFRISKPASEGAKADDYAAFFETSKDATGYEAGQPYVTSVRLRAKDNGFKVQIGAMVGDQFLGDTIELSSRWEDYTIVVASAVAGSALKLPYLALGQNAQEGWVEGFKLKMEPGVMPTPAVPPASLLTTARARSVPEGIVWSCENGDLFTVDIGADRNLKVPTGMAHDGQVLTLRIRQDATGGRQVGLNSGFRVSSIPWKASTTPYGLTVATFQFDEFTGKWGLINLASFD